jgi:hypothetical protein
LSGEGVVCRVEGEGAETEVVEVGWVRLRSDSRSVDREDVVGSKSKIKNTLDSTVNISIYIHPDSEQSQNQHQKPEKIK